jgi:hypothetical protein
VDVRFAALPVKTPVPAIMDAMVGALLVHVPPGVASVRVILLCKQIMPGPAIGDSGLTVTDARAVQPELRVYDITVEPAVTPVIVPLVPMVAIAVFAELQVPPEPGSVAGDVVPAHKGMVVDKEMGCKG